MSGVEEARENLRRALLRMLEHMGQEKTVEVVLVTIDQLTRQVGELRSWKQEVRGPLVYLVRETRRLLEQAGVEPPADVRQIMADLIEVLSRE